MRNIQLTEHLLPQILRKMFVYILLEIKGKEKKFTYLPKIPINDQLNGKKNHT